MPLPAPLLRGNSRSSKKDLGALLMIAGSPSMLGAAALSSLAAMRSGAGLVTAAVPRGLNSTLQKKISHVVMTMPLDQGPSGAFAYKAFDQLAKIWDRYDAIAIGPGLGRDPGTLKMARQVILHCPKPLLIDADALFALVGHLGLLLKSKAKRVLTPHSGEMSRLTGRSIREIEASRLRSALNFARRTNCVLLLKGHRTVVASCQGKTYINQTGNEGMATAGSGDVLTGMITSFMGQGNTPFQSACWGAYFHGKAGDQAAKIRSKRGMIAADIIERIPYLFKNV